MTNKIQGEFGEPATIISPDNHLTQSVATQETAGGEAKRRRRCKFTGRLSNHCAVTTLGGDTSLAQSRVFFGIRIGTEN
jgi:hypothetical protein